MKRQKWERLVLDAHKARVGWYEGHGAQGLFYPINYSNKPTGVPSPVQSERLLSKTQSSKYTFPPVFQGYPEVNATSNIQEHMTFKSLPSQQGQLHADLPGPDHHHSTMALAAKGERMQGKGQGSGGEIVSYLNRPKWPKVLPQPPLLPKQEKSML